MLLGSINGLGSGLLDKRVVEDCPYHERGFCKLGIYQCGLGHAPYPTKICPNYAIGFCPKGPNCELEHVKSIVADTDLTLMTLANFPPSEDWVDRNAVAALTGQNLLPFHKPMVNVLCHRCGQTGHKSTYCQED
jgi:hypothetical protein